MLHRPRTDAELSLHPAAESEHLTSFVEEKRVLEAALDLDKLVYRAIITGEVLL